MTLKDMVKDLPFFSLHDFLKNTEDNGGVMYLLGLLGHTAWALSPVLYTAGSLLTHNPNPVEWPQELREIVNPTYQENLEEQKFEDSERVLYRT